MTRHLHPILHEESSSRQHPIQILFILPLHQDLYPRKRRVLLDFALFEAFLCRDNYVRMEAAAAPDESLGEESDGGEVYDIVVLILAFTYHLFAIYEVYSILS